MRQATADLVEGADIPEGGFDEDSKMPRDKYVTKLRRNGTFTGHIELQELAKALKAWIAIYLADQRYQTKPWQIIKHENIPKPEGLIFLKFRQGNQTTRDTTAHYDALMNTLGQTKMRSNKLKLIGKESNQTDLPPHSEPAQRKLVPFKGLLINARRVQ